MRKYKRIISLFCLLSIMPLFYGCTIVDNIKLKFNMINKDFEFLGDGKTDKIVIQSTRDTSFRFIVTDKNTIKEVYKLLSNAKTTSQKSSYKSDYIFEVYLGDEVKKYNYVVGDYESDRGNFYDDDKCYIVSKRLDNDIIQNLESIRKPRDFKNVYYKSILETIEKNKDVLNKDNKAVGIDISGDIDVTKYQYSIDIDYFLNDVKDIVPKANIVNKDRENYDIIVKVRTYGYKTSKYKAIITIENKEEKSETNYYIDCSNKSSSWEINILDKKPATW